MEPQKPKGFGKFDKLARKLVQVPPTEIATMPTDAMIEAAAEAIANARGMRRGVPPITGILAALPSKLHDEVMEDAKAALEAAEKVRPAK